MRNKTFILMIMSLILIVSLVAGLSAQTLPVDSRRKEMQFHKSFECLRYSPAADTLWHKVTLPARCMEVWCLADSGAVVISPDSLYYDTAKPYAWIVPGTPFILPTYKTPYIWVKRAASATVAHLNLIFYKM